MHPRLSLSALATLLAMPATAADLSGWYEAQGMNPDGSRYTGQVELTENGGAVSMTWDVAGSSYAGAGTIDGKLITVQWGNPNPIYYVITPSGELHGTWAGGTALEKLVPLP